MPIRLAASPRKARARSSSRLASPKQSVVSEGAIATRVGSQNRSRQSRPGSVKACRARGASRQAWASSGPAVSSASSSPMRRRMPCGPRARRRATHCASVSAVSAHSRSMLGRWRVSIVLDEGEDPGVAAVKLGRCADQHRVDVGSIECERGGGGIQRQHDAEPRGAGPQPCLVLLLVVAQSARGTIRRASRWRARSPPATGRRERSVMQ